MVVEQSVNVALRLAERAVFMEKGEFRFTGSTAGAARPARHPALGVHRRRRGAGARRRRRRRRRRKGRRKQGRAARRPTRRVAPVADAPKILECDGVVKRFGGITAVDHVDLELREGEILGLIGQNGAGKTTLFDCISGFLPIDGGRVALRRRGHHRPARRTSGPLRGLGRSFQEARLFPSLTTAETLAVARERHLLSHGMVAAALGQPVARDSEDDVAEKVDVLIELMGLGAFREKLTGELSTGTRRIVELACLLASDPAVIVLDEPSGGVAQKETEALGPLLQRVQAATGASILVIEHDMPLLVGALRPDVALELGAVIAEGTPAEVLDHPRVIESYLGTDVTAIHRSGALV